MEVTENKGKGCLQEFIEAGGIFVGTERADAYLRNSSKPPFLSQVYNHTPSNCRMSEMETQPRNPNPDILDPLLEPYRAVEGAEAPEDSLGKRVFERVHKTDKPAKTLCQEY